jgi:MacB-like periplasmic core domain
MPRGQDVSSWTGPAFFRTAGVPIVAGRGFTDADRAGAQGVVVVNRTMAAKFWPNESPLGKRFHFHGKPPVATREEALAAAQALALRVLADKLEHGEAPAAPLDLSFVVNALDHLARLQGLP